MLRQRDLSAVNGITRYAGFLLRDPVSARHVVDHILADMESNGPGYKPGNSIPELYDAVYRRSIRQLKEKTWNPRPGSYSGEQDMQETEIHSGLQFCFLKIPGYYRNLLRLAIAETKTYADIAWEMRISVHEVKAGMGRALAMIRQILLPQVPELRNGSYLQFGLDEAKLACYLCGESNPGEAFLIENWLGFESGNLKTFEYLCSVWQLTSKRHFRINPS